MPKLNVSAKSATPILGSLYPTRVGVFISEFDTGRPIASLPLYAEVAVPRIDIAPPQKFKFLEPIRKSIDLVDREISKEDRLAIEAAAQEAFDEVFDKETQKKLNDDKVKTSHQIQEVFEAVLAESGQKNLRDIPKSEIKARIVKAFQNFARANGITPLTDKSDAGLIWANPLGVLTTDHVGYVSFDLGRLRPDVYAMLLTAIEQRRNDPDEPLKTTVWIYPYGQTERFDVLAQGRFTQDAIIARFTLQSVISKPNLTNFGGRSLQNPSLTDWWVSPASFATNPRMLVGDTGCEQLLPANLALAEFVIRQIVRLTDVPPDMNVPGCKAAYVDEYKVSWHSLGHSLGEILYSLPLAPGETVKLAVIDWSWDSLTKRDETTKLTEDVIHKTHRDRTITETVKAGLDEMQHGSSFMAGTAGSAGATGSYGAGALGVGAAVGNTFSLGGSTASSEGSRDLAVENVQRLSDSFTQASFSQREMNSTVVIQARQEEKESIQTRTFSNYNHSHTLTILYYEVLRHYRLKVEWIRRRPAILAQVPERIDEFKPDNILLHRLLLQTSLLDQTLIPAFDALEKQETIRANQVALGLTPSNTPVPQFWEGDLEFSGFEIGVRSKDSDKTDEVITVYIMTADQGLDEKKFELHVVFKGGGATFHDFNNNQRFNKTDSMQWAFVKPFDRNAGKLVTIHWHEIVGFQFEKWGEDPWRIDFITINAFGSNGLFIPLTDAERDVDLFFVKGQPTSQTLTWFNRPGPRPPALDPVRSPEANLTPEELLLVTKLIRHVNANKQYYNRIIILSTDTATIADELEKKTVGPGKTMADHVDPIALEVFGPYVAYPLARKAKVTATDIAAISAAIRSNDTDKQKWAVEKLAALSDAEIQQVADDVALAAATAEQLITLPTRGVFAEGELGHCNISEEIDNTRFWKWEEHPIPIEAPDINPVTPIQPQPQQVDATPTAFPQPIVNIVNPTPAPDPSGLGPALALLGTPNIFRDMSGRQEVADLLKRLSDNTIKIADAANAARGIQAKYGANLDQNQGASGGQSHPDPEVAKTQIQQRREEAQQVTPDQAHDAIKVSENEMKKGNKTPEEHKIYSADVQNNVKGATNTKKQEKTENTSGLTFFLNFKRVVVNTPVEGRAEVTITPLSTVAITKEGKYEEFKPGESIGPPQKGQIAPKKYIDIPIENSAVRIVTGDVTAPGTIKVEVWYKMRFVAGNNPVLRVDYEDESIADIKNSEIHFKNDERYEQPTSGNIVFFDIIPTVKPVTVEITDEDKTLSEVSDEVGIELEKIVGVKASAKVGGEKTTGKKTAVTITYLTGGLDITQSNKPK
mgnify:CR=1 FL=1